MKFMKHFDIKNRFLYQTLGATVLDSSYSIQSMVKIMNNSLRKKWDLTQASKNRKDRKAFFLLSFQAQCLAYGEHSIGAGE